MPSKPGARNAVGALKELSKVEVPEGGDVDGDALNSPAVLRRLQPHVQDAVLRNTAIVADYMRRDGDMGAVPNKRGATAITRAGFSVSLNQDQYEDRLAGRAGNDNFHVDIGDPPVEEE